MENAEYGTGSWRSGTTVTLNLELSLQVCYIFQSSYNNSYSGYALEHALLFPAMVCPSVVSRCKEILWKQLNQNSDLRHLANEEGQIKSRLVDAFDRRVSTSILVVGPTGSGKRELVEKVMIDYCSEGIKNSKPVSVARINGLVHLNDNQVRGCFNGRRMNS